MNKKKRRPSTQTIKRVFDWLEEHQMSVYGPFVNLERKLIYGSNQDFDVVKAIRFATLQDKGQMKEADHDQ